MNNFFLFNDAVDLNEMNQFKLGMLELVVIEREKGDAFQKHESLYHLNIIGSLYSTFGQEEQVISKFIEQLTTIETYIGCEEVFEKVYPEMCNAFLGINFSKLNISEPKQIINNITFQQFKNDNLWNVTYRNLWDKKEKLFPHLILCGEVNEQIAKIGRSSQFNQILDRLTELNTAVSKWTSGDFSYREINKNSSLRISPESDLTMTKYGNERVFRLPSGGTETFELHIKTGDLRFHFLPDSNKKKVYVGYIGPHLSTISN